MERWAEILRSDATGWGAATFLVAAFVWSLWSGRLILGRTHEQILDRENREKEHWRRAFFVEQENTRQAVETGQETRQVLKALPIDRPQP